MSLKSFNGISLKFEVSLENHSSYSDWHCYYFYYCCRDHSGIVARGEFGRDFVS